MQSMTALTDDFAQNVGVLQESESLQSTNMTQSGASNSASTARSAVSVKFLPHEASHDGEDRPSVSIGLNETAHQGIEPCCNSGETI